MKHLIPITFCLMASHSPFALASGDKASDGWMDSFDLERYTLSANGENRHFSLKPGRYVVMGKLQQKGAAFVIITVLDETETIDGTVTRVVEEREFEDGELIEVSRNFFAIAKETSDIFYFGEDVDDYKDGKVVGHTGGWRAGKDGARAGLAIPGKPMAGMKYYIEVAPGVAMDRAEVIKTNATIETPAGSFEECLVVTESSPLEPGHDSYKRYAPGVGMILDDEVELMKYGWRDDSERIIELEIKKGQIPATPADALRKLHPKGDIREVKVELHKDRVVYAVETFVGPQQYDVEVTEGGKVLRNEAD
jgi:hypothetical protein